MLVEGQHVHGSPFSILAKPSFQGSKSRAFGPALESPTEGEKSPLFVEVKDRDGSTVLDLHEDQLDIVVNDTVKVEEKQQTVDGAWKVDIPVPKGAESNNMS